MRESHGVYFVVLWLGFIVLAGVMYLFMLNCHFGWDSLFYFVTGEDWLRGAPPYTRYFDIKPIGAFWVARLLLSELGNSPYVLNLGILAINLTLVGATVMSARRWLDPVQRAALAVFLLVMGFMTEMIYLLADQPLAICGVAGFSALYSPLFADRLRRRCLVSGAALGVGLVFKVTACFYVIGAAVIVATQVLRSQRGVRCGRTILIAWSLLWFGFLLPTSIVCVWAFRNGILSKMLYDSLWGPLALFPGYADNLPAFARKLGPFLLIWIMAVLIWFRRRRDLERDRNFWLEGLMIFSLCAMLALVKIQSGHYLIAALPFLCTFILAVFSDRSCWQYFSRLELMAGLLLSLICVAVVVNRQKLLARVALPDFTSDRQLALGLVQFTHPGESALFINGSATLATYWTTGLRPPEGWTTLAIEPWSYALATKNKGSLLRAMENQRTVLVGMIRKESPFYLDRPWPFADEEMAGAERVLHERFEPVAEVGGIKVRGIWKLKGRSPDASRTISGGPFVDRQER